MTTPGQRPTMGPAYQPAGRPVLIFHHGETMKCFNGHTIDHCVIEMTVFRCKKLLERGGRHCDQRLFIMGGIMSLRGDPGGVLVTQITAQEEAILNRSTELSPRAVLRLLGLTL